MVTVCGQIQICYAVVAMTIPCLRPFMSALNTHYGGPTESRTPGGTRLGSKLSRITGKSNKSSNKSKTDREEAGSYALGNLSTVAAATANLKSSDPIQSEPVSPGLPGLPSRWDRSEHRSEHRSSVASRSNRKSSIGYDAHSTQSNDSQRIIISKNIEWQVEFQGDETEHSQHSHPSL